MRALYDRIRGDAFWKSPEMGTVFVPGEGRAGNASLVMVGEAPGRDEETLQRPFVGAAGRNLNRLLLEVGLTRGDMFITNLIKFRPVNNRGMNRSPSPVERRQATPYILAELEILSPKLVVCLGLSAAKVLLEDGTLKMSAANGAVFHKHFFQTIVTYHPSPLNYCSPIKREALRSAFRQIRSMLTF